MLPFELTVQTPDAPDPALSSVTLKATCTLPGALVNWPVDGQDQLGIDFAGITAADVTVPSITGLPALDAARFTAAIHTRYTELPTHTFTLVGQHARALRRQPRSHARAAERGHAERDPVRDREPRRQGLPEDDPADPRHRAGGGLLRLRQGDLLARDRRWAMPRSR